MHQKKQLLRLMSALYLGWLKHFYVVSELTVDLN